MAILKSLKPKEKEFIFSSWGNDLEKNPCKIIFSKFPDLGESYTTAEKKYLFKGVDLKNDLEESIINKLTNNFIDNLKAGRINYKSFFKDCVLGFKDFFYDKNEIITIDDFWEKIPFDCAYVIAQEAYVYAMKREEFTMGESNA